MIQALWCVVMHQPDGTWDLLPTDRWEIAQAIATAYKSSFRRAAYAVRRA